jgi:glycosyltransferase involved in cell wall biosynthesis
MKKQLSILIPVFNEEDSIKILYKEIKEVLGNFSYSYEIIFVDDGSFDNTLNELKKIADPNIKIISFDKNYGQSTALTAGIKEIEGDIVITMDGDLQNDPQDIPKLLKYIEQGYDVVSGRRKKRKDSFLKRVSSKIANYIRNKLLKDGLKDIGCTLKAYKSDYLKKIKLFNGMHRFLPILCQLEGAKIIEVEVNHRERKFGKSKYGLKNRLIKPFLDLLFVWWMKKNYINYKKLKF